MNSKRFDDMKVQTQGSFGGLGIEVTMEGGLVKVVSPIDDTPAFKAGIEPGDFITHLDGEQIQGMTLPDAVEKMRGPAGSTIKLTIRRADREPFEVTLTRQVIKIKSVKSRLEGKVGYVRISSFSEQTDAGLREEIEKLKREANRPLQGIVLDLRNNPGGLLTQAVAVADDFLDKGEIVSTRARKPEEAQRFNAKPGDLAEGLPIVVLINGGSASASEIVAGALQDHKRAIVLGTKSFGKGSVQTIIPLSGHGAMRLTTARYYTPSGRSIQAVGIEPDIVVEPARIELMKEANLRREADLRGALDRKPPAAAPAPSAPSPAATRSRPPRARRRRSITSCCAPSIWFEACLCTRNGRTIRSIDPANEEPTLAGGLKGAVAARSRRLSLGQDGKSGSSATLRCGRRRLRCRARRSCSFFSYSGCSLQSPMVAARGEVVLGAEACG